ncbi:MAG: hypothetical protein AAGE84_23565 [Cyanobacteria bacterium P01_G01_bin.39]
MVKIECLCISRFQSKNIGWASSKQANDKITIAPLNLAMRLRDPYPKDRLTK